MANWARSPSTDRFTSPLKDAANHFLIFWGRTEWTPGQWGGTKVTVWRKNSLTLVGFKLVTQGREARLLTMRPLGPLPLNLPPRSLANNFYSVIIKLLSLQIGCCLALDVQVNATISTLLPISRCDVQHCPPDSSATVCSALDLPTILLVLFGVLVSLESLQHTLSWIL